MDGKSGLQLLPGTKKRLGIKVPGENRFLYIGSAILGAILVTIFALNRQESSLMAQIASLNDQITSLEQSRNKNDESDLRLIKDRLAVTGNLIKEHTYWTQAFYWLGSSLQSGIQITAMSIGVDSKLSLVGKADSYTTIARQISSFLTDSKVKDIDIGALSPSSDGTIEFSMELELNVKSIILK